MKTAIDVSRAALNLRQRRFAQVYFGQSEISWTRLPTEAQRERLSQSRVESVQATASTWDENYATASENRGDGKSQKFSSEMCGKSARYPNEVAINENSLDDKL